MFLQLPSPSRTSIAILLVKEIQLTSSFPLSLPENYHSKNSRKFVQMMKLNGIRIIKIQNGEKERDTDSQLLGSICPSHYWLKYCWPHRQKLIHKRVTARLILRALFLRNQISQCPPQFGPKPPYLHLPPTTLLCEFCIPAKSACLSFCKYAVCPVTPSPYPPPAGPLGHQPAKE